MLTTIVEYATGATSKDPRFAARASNLYCINKNIIINNCGIFVIYRETCQVLESNSKLISYHLLTHDKMTDRSKCNPSGPSNNLQDDYAEGSFLQS